MVMPGTAGKPEQKMCPILGMVVVPEVVPPKIHAVGREPEMQLGIKFNVCVEEKCMFWNVGGKYCAIKSGAEALVALKGTVDKHESKLSILSMFSKKE